MSHILVEGRFRFLHYGERVMEVKKFFYKTIRGAIRIFDGSKFDSINITCELETQKDIEHLIKFLEVSKKSLKIK